jgi:hypothetical protein
MEKHDCLTYNEYWAARGEEPPTKAPTPWWLLTGGKPPDPPTPPAAEGDYRLGNRHHPHPGGGW